MAGTAILLYCNEPGIEQEVDVDEHPGADQALKKYAGLVRDVVKELCAQRQFSNIELKEFSESYEADGTSTPLALVSGAAKRDDDGNLLGVTEPQYVFDLMGAMTASRALPSLFNDRVGLSEDGVLEFTDMKMGKQATKINEQLGLENRYTDLVSEEEDEAVAEALGSLVPEDTELMPLHPEDVLAILSAFVAHVSANAVKPSRAPGTSRPNPVAQLKSLVGNLLGAGKGALGRVGGSTRGIRRAVWRAEDLVQAVVKNGAKVASHAIRPVLVALVLHRVLKTIDASRDINVRIARMPRQKAQHEWFKHLLGEDYGKQIEQDLLDAVKEVNEGYVTDDYLDEKRLITAAMIRRLEVEDWDKERMKHFYYGSYGLGPWYFDMEERLHNPYFIGGRAWNGPIQGWVGKNKTYDDLPAANTDFAAAAMNAIEGAAGIPLTSSQKARILEKEVPNARDFLTAKGGLLDGVVPAEKVAAYLDEKAEAL